MSWVAIALYFEVILYVQRLVIALSTFPTVSISFFLSLTFTSDVISHFTSETRKHDNRRVLQLSNQLQTETPFIPQLRLLIGSIITVASVTTLVPFLFYSVHYSSLVFFPYFPFFSSFTSFLYRIPLSHRPYVRVRVCVCVWCLGWCSCWQRPLLLVWENRFTISLLDSIPDFLLGTCFAGSFTVLVAALTRESYERVVQQPVGSSDVVCGRETRPSRRSMWSVSCRCLLSVVLLSFGDLCAFPFPIGSPDTSIASIGWTTLVTIRAGHVIAIKTRWH